MVKTKKKMALELLPPRERQILDCVYRIKEGSVAEVLAGLENAPSYSAVRAMLNILVRKNFLEYRREKTRYLYSPVVPQVEAPQSLLRNLLDTFFAGNPSAAVAALLDVAGPQLSDKDILEMEQLIHNVKNEAKENRK